MRMRQEAAKRARVQPPASCREEDRVHCAVRQLRPAILEVAAQPVRGLLAERDDAFLVAFAPDAYGLLLEVDILEVEPDGLGAAQAGRVDELEERAVAERQGVVR